MLSAKAITLFAADGAIVPGKIIANNCINYFDFIAIFAINYLTSVRKGWPAAAQPLPGAARRHTAQQAQPSAPKKPFRSAIGSFAVHALAWSWPWTLQELVQPQVEIAVRRNEFKPAPCGSPQAA
jgi:hypothetical protein